MRCHHYMMSLHRPHVMVLAAARPNRSDIKREVMTEFMDDTRCDIKKLHVRDT